jgi:hypothetical protein
MKNKNYIEVPVDKVISESNRKHGGTGNIDILAESIKQYGLRTPPEVVEAETGGLPPYETGQEQQNEKRKRTLP